MTLPSRLLGGLAVAAVAGTMLSMFAKHPNVPPQRRPQFDAAGDALLGFGVSASLVAFDYDAGYAGNVTAQVVFWSIVVVLMLAFVGLLIYVRPDRVTEPVQRDERAASDHTESKKRRDPEKE